MDAINQPNIEQPTIDQLTVDQSLEKILYPWINWKNTRVGGSYAMHKWLSNVGPCDWEPAGIDLFVDLKDREFHDYVIKVVNATGSELVAGPDSVKSGAFFESTNYVVIHNAGIKIPICFIQAVDMFPIKNQLVDAPCIFYTPVPVIGDAANDEEYTTWRVIFEIPEEYVYGLLTRRVCIEHSSNDMIEKYTDKGFTFY